MSENLYDTLGVDKNATDEEIKSAYYEKAKDNHPDLQDGDIEAMKAINAAYAILKCEKKRRKYDETGDSDSVDNNQAKVTSIIIQIATTIIDNNPPNIPMFIQKIKREWENNYRNGKRQKENELKKLEDFKARILERPENDVFTAIINENIKTLKYMIADIDDDYAIRQQAFDLLQRYSFTEVMQAQFQTTMSVGTFTFL